MKKLLLGTNNVSKLQGMTEDVQFFCPGVVCLSPAAIGLTDIQPAEDAVTAAENALNKARTWHEASGLAVLAEDSGLVFLDLPADHPDQPGVRVRRMNGSSWMDDDEMLDWYAAIARRHGGSLRACWSDAWCIVDEDGTAHPFTMSQEVLSANAFLLTATPCAARTPGWPLDSLSVHPEIGGLYKAEMTADDSVRLKAIRSETARRYQYKYVRWLRDTLT